MPDGLNFSHLHDLGNNPYGYIQAPLNHTACATHHPSVAHLPQLSHHHQPYLQEHMPGNMVSMLPLDHTEFPIQSTAPPANRKQQKKSKKPASGKRKGQRAPQSAPKRSRKRRLTSQEFPSVPMGNSVGVSELVGDNMGHMLLTPGLENLPEMREDISLDFDNVFLPGVNIRSEPFPIPSNLNCGCNCLRNLATKGAPSHQC